MYWIWWSLSYPGMNTVNSWRVAKVPLSVMSMNSGCNVSSLHTFPAYLKAAGWAMNCLAWLLWASRLHHKHRQTFCTLTYFSLFYLLAWLLTRHSNFKSIYLPRSWCRWILWVAWNEKVRNVLWPSWISPPEQKETDASSLNPTNYQHLSGCDPCHIKGGTRESHQGTKCLLLLSGTHLLWSEGHCPWGVLPDYETMCLYHAGFLSYIYWKNYLRPM